MKHIIAAVALSTLVVQPTLASAQEAVAPTAFDLTVPSPGYTYFHRAGATIEEHDAAVRDCGRQAARMAQPQDSSAAAAGAAGGLLGALVVGAVSGYVQAKRNSRALGANLENCMVIDGWAVRSLPAVEGEALDKLEQPALHEALALRFAAAEPDDEQVRVFGNELRRQPPAAFGWAGDMDALSLSLQALPPLEQQPEATPRPRLPRQPRSARPPRALTETQLAETQLAEAAAPDSALVVIKLKGLSQQSGRTLTFVRAGQDSDTPAWAADQRPDRFTVGLTHRAATRGDAGRFNTEAFAIPPGRWRLASMTQAPVSLSLCRGAPAFEVAAGQVAFLGEFDLSGGGAAPALDLEKADLPPAYAALTPTPVTWTDGGVATCEGAYLYAAFVNEAQSRPAAAITEASNAAEPVAASDTSSQTGADPSAAPDQPAPGEQQI